MGVKLTSPQVINFHWADLCHAAITVGRRSWADVFQHSTHSWLEALWRVAMIRSALVQETNGHLRLSQAFHALDASEKTAISYFLGLTLAKLITARLFRVPWLLHLDVYRKRLNPTFVTTKRPDFVGIDAYGNWIVVEAKGRRRLSSITMAHAKSQTRSRRTVAGSLPLVRCAIGMHFHSGTMAAEVHDPEDSAPDSIDLAITRDDLVQLYYEPIMQMPARETENFPSATDSEDLIELLGMDVRISIDADVKRWYSRQARGFSNLVGQQRQSLSVLAAIDTLRKISPDDVDSDVSGDLIDAPIDDGWSQSTNERADGADGINVILGPSWRPEIMRLEPETRARG